MKSYRDYYHATITVTITTVVEYLDVVGVAQRGERGGAWMVKRSQIGSFGGGSVEHPRHWLGAQWAGLFLGAPSCPEPPGAP
eukprot:scaffold111252_cov63-Phaeocystis_antarctica.AAC.1